MAIDFPSEEWIKEWGVKLNENEEYAELGADWGVGFNGAFVFTVEEDELLDETLYYFVDLEGGKCKDSHQIDSPDDVNFGFEIRGPYANWKELAQGNIGAIDGLMSGKFELNGDMQKVMQYSDAAVTMVESATSIDTEFKY